MYAIFTFFFFEKKIARYRLSARTSAFAQRHAAWPNTVRRPCSDGSKLVGRGLEVGRSNRHRPTFLTLNPIQNFRKKVGRWTKNKGEEENFSLLSFY